MTQGPSPASSPAPIAAVILDKDGVLVDFERTWTPLIRAAALDFAAGDAARALELLRKVGFDENSGTFRPNSIWAAGTNADLIRAWAGAESPARQAELVEKMARRCARVAPAPLAPPEELRRRLRRLKARGVKLAVISNDATVSVRGMARAFGIADLLDFMCGFDAVENPKPAADPVLAFAAATGLPPARMAVIGDNAHDACMARAAGCATFIGALSGNSGADALAPLSDHVVPDVLAALDLLETKT